MKSYNPNRKFKNKRSVAAIAAVVVLAIALVVAGIAVAVTEKNVPPREIVSIEFVSGKLGANADFDKVFVKVVFSDRTTESMSLSQFLPTGIDRTKEGTQNITLSYGNREFSVAVDVVLTDMKINYVTSGEGGRIAGDLEQSVPAGESGTEVEAIANDGYYFDRWDDDVRSAVRREESVERNRTIRAIFKKQEFLVTFLYADGTNLSQHVQYGERAEPIADTDSRLKKYGYRFDGWDTDEWKNVTRDVTVRPKMTPVKANYDIYVSALNGEPMGVKDITDTNVVTDSLNGYNESAGMDASSNYFLYKGYYEWGLAGAVSMSEVQGRVFDHWEIYGSAVADGQAQFWTLGRNSELGLWLPGAKERIVFLSNASVTAPKLNFRLSDGSELLTVRAVYAKAASSVTFFTNGTQLGERTVSLPFGETLTAEDLRAPAERVGYDFIGWFTETDQKNQVTPGHAPFYVDTKLNAKYEPRTITVTFQTTDGEVTKSAKFDQMLANAEFPPIPDRPDYLADGWIVTESAEDSTLVGTVFSAETKLSENVTVAPNYKRINFDATIEKTGLGRVFVTETDGSTAGAETEVTGSFLSLKSGARYTFRFEGDAENGFEFKEYKLQYDGSPETTAQSAEFVITSLNKGFRLIAVFTEKNYTVRVENGAAGTAGTVTALGVAYASDRFEFEIASGKPLSLLIVAPDKMRIAGIYADGDNVTNLIPDGVFDSYNYHYAGGADGTVGSPVSIRIVYAEKEFELRTSIGGGGGAAYATWNGGSFDAYDLADGRTFRYGSVLRIEIAAEAGKYISNLTLFGKTVDFYERYYESFDASLLNRGETYFMTNRVRKGFGTKDPRVSKIVLYLDAPDQTTELSVAFEDVYYNVTVVSTGFGTATIDKNAVPENGSVGLTMQTDDSYVIERYTRTNHRETDETTEPPIGGNNSSLRETVGGIDSDVTLEVRFARRLYVVLFYNLTEDGVFYNVTADGTETRVDRDSAPSFQLAYGDSKTYRLTAREGYEIAKVIFVDGGENVTGEVQLPAGIDGYDLVLNKISASRGVKVELRRKSYALRVSTNAVTERIGKILYSVDGGAEETYPAGGTVSVEYGAAVKLRAEASTDFTVGSFAMGGAEFPAGTNRAEWTVAGAVEIEILFAYQGAESGVIIDENLESGGSAHGVVTAETDGNFWKFRVSPDPGYALKGIYANGELLPHEVLGDYYYLEIPSASGARNAGGFWFITAIFEQRTLQLSLFAENGTLTSDRSYVGYGDTASVYFVANTGYRLTSVKKNGQTIAAESEEFKRILESGTLTLGAEDTKNSSGTVSVTATFGAIGYVLETEFDLAGDGRGTIVLEDGREINGSERFDVSYGEKRTFRFRADEGSYLQAVYLNGVAVELTALADAVVKESNGKYASGKYELIVTGETRVGVKFSEDVFKVAVTEAAGGVTAISKSASGGDEYGANESITVTLKAYTGYHIAALYINGAAQPLNLYSTEDPNLNTDILYSMPRDLLKENLVVRADFERNEYSVKVTAENVSPNFKGTDATSDRFLDKLGLEFGGGELQGEAETDRANARYTVVFRGIEHAGTPRATIRPRTNSGYVVKRVVISYRTADGRDTEADYTSLFTEENGYQATLPAMYWNITEFKVELTRKTFDVTIPATYHNEVGRTAIRIAPSFYAGAVAAIAEHEPAGNVYRYEFGVRIELLITMTEGFTPTRFRMTTNVTRDFLRDLTFAGGKATYVATLTDTTEFAFEAAVTMISLTLEKVGSGTGTYNFLVGGTSRPGERELTVEYGTNVGIVAIAGRAQGSYLRAIRINGIPQSLGAAEADGYHYQVSLAGKATADAEYEVDLSILEYRFHTSTPEGVQGVSYNNDVGSIFPWGTERVSVRIELALGYELLSLKVNGKEVAAEDYVADDTVVTFVVKDIDSDQEIVPAVRKKTFTARNNASSVGENKTEIYKIGADGAAELIENNRVGNISYGDRIYFTLNPMKNYYVNSYTVTMKTLTGLEEIKNGAESAPEERNLDIVRVDLGAVTGDVNMEVLYERKLYNIVYTNLAGAAGVGDITIGESQILGGDGTTVSIKTKNLLSEDGRSTVYYGVSSVRVNGYEYFKETIALTGWGTRETERYDSAQKTYEFRYNFTASDELMLGDDTRIGSGRNFNLNLEIIIERNLYYLDEVVVRNRESGTDEERVLSAEGGTFETEAFSGRFSESIFDGSSDLLELDMTAAYSPTAVKTRTDDTKEYTVQEYEKNAGSQKVLVTASADVADMNNPYRKKLRFVIEIDRNRYDTGLSVVTYQPGETLADGKEGDEKTIGENNRGVSAILNDDTHPSDAALTRIAHGARVTVTAGEQPEYEFAGFEFYDETTGAWYAAVNVTENGVPIVSVDGNELNISVVKKFLYRAIYYKKVSVDVVIAPWHKYYSGNYVGGNGADTSYVTYASMIVTVGGAEKKWEVEQSKNDRGIFRFVFRYGDDVLIEARDTKSATNGSSKTTYYYQNFGNEIAMTATGSVGAGQMRFAAKEELVYSEQLDGNNALYATFDNNIKLNVDTETLGGAEARDGATVTYRRKPAGLNTSFSPLSLTSGRTANVKMFDRIEATIVLTDGYRFEGFSRYIAERDSVNLNFSNTTETMAAFRATGYDTWELLGKADDPTLTSDDRFNIEKKSETELVITFTVADNSIYRFDFVKVYEVKGSVSAPRYAGDTETNGIAPAILVASGNKSYFPDGGTTGKLDYGAEISMTLPNRVGSEYENETRWQFVSWYANGVAVKSSAIRNFNYYDAYADERIVLTEQYGFVGVEKTSRTFDFYAEFMPIYEFASREHYEIGGATFRPTSVFEMNGLYYDKTGSQVQIPSSRYSVSVNPGDGSLITKQYLPFDARKGGKGNPAGAGDANALTLSVVNAVSYSILSWRIYYGDYDPLHPDAGSYGEYAGNTQEIAFTMTKEVYDELTASGGSAFRAVTVVPVFSKKNDVVIRKSVFYTNYGVPSQTGRADNNPGIRSGELIDTDALREGMISINYGDVIRIDPNPNASYEFIGWFDPATPQDSVTPDYPDRILEINANKTSNTDYTFNYEARYIRTVGLTLTTINNSGSYLKGSSADILKGDPTDGVWLYQGTDVSKTMSKALLTSFASENSGNAAALTANVGSYALFKLSGTRNARGFDPQYDVFKELQSTTGAVNYTATEEADGSWRVVVYLDQTKVVGAQYETYGTVTLTGLLDRSKVTLGVNMSKNIYDYAAFLKLRRGSNDPVGDEDILSVAFDTDEVIAARYDAATKRITAELNTRNTSGSVSVKGVKMLNSTSSARYDTDVLSFRFNGFEKISDPWEETLGIGFSGDSMSAKTVSTKVKTMPFAGGAGTEANPYLISDYASFKNIGVMFNKNESSLENVYLVQTADIVLGDWTPMCADGDGFNGHLDGRDHALTVPATLETAGNMTTGGIFAKTGIGTIRSYRFLMGAAKVNLTHGATSESGIVAGVANGTAFEELTFENFKVDARGKSFGLVAGTATEARATNVTVTNLNLEYQLSDKGAVFGKATDTVLDNITFVREANSGAVFQNAGTASRIGGIVGTLTGAGSELKNSVIRGGNIRATAEVGGAVGRLSDGAKITNVGAVLEKLVTAGSEKVPQALQVAADSVIRGGSQGTSPTVAVRQESDAVEFAAGGLVGYLSRATAEGLYVDSELVYNGESDLFKVTSPDVLYRNYPTVSVLGSVAGGLVGIVGAGSTLKESYIEAGATAEILMPSRTDVNASSSAASTGSDGIFGGLAGLNAGLIYHSGINGGTYSGKDAFGLDQASGSPATNETSTAQTLGNSSPLQSGGGSSRGLQLNASVEFLYAVHTNSGGKLQRSQKNGFFYGANYVNAHGSSNDYTGDGFAARGTSVTVMGGVAGYNSGSVVSDYVAGKVVHFRRHRTEASGTLYSILGGVVGWNANIVYGSGIVNAAVYNLTKPVTNDVKQSAVASAGGGIGHASVNYVRGLFSVNSAVRAVIDPWAQAANKAGAGTGSTFHAVSSGLVSNVTGTTSAFLSYGAGNKVSATQDAVNANNSQFTRLAGVAGISFVYNTTNDLGGTTNGVYSSGNLAGLRNATVAIDGGSYSGNAYFGDQYPILLSENFLTTGTALKYLGKKSGNNISFSR